MRSIVFFLSLAALLAGCAADKTSEKLATADSATCAAPGVNPNGDSELALLMRQMVITTQATKDSLEKNAAIPSYPESIERIFIAKKTDPSIDKELFNTLANAYVENVKHFYEVPTKERNTAYNAMVNSCVACHENFCGGPLKRINKLLLPQ